MHYMTFGAWSVKQSKASYDAEWKSLDYGFSYDAVGTWRANVCFDEKGTSATVAHSPS